MAFQVGGVDLSGDITSYAHIENPTNVGNYETVKCKVTFVKPDQKTDDDGKKVAGIVKSDYKDGRGNQTVENGYGILNLQSETTGPWILDSTNPGVSYTSWFEYPAEKEETKRQLEDTAETSKVAPKINSWQLCSVARNVDSNITGIASSDVNLDWKLGTEYTALTGFKYVKSGESEETEIVG